MSAVKVAMRSQTAFGQSQEILGTRNAPKILIVPNELEDRAMRIVNPSDAYATALASSTDTNTELDPHTFKNSGIVVHVYDQLTDATDWWVVADPTKVPTIVMGFLNGRTEPELFTQDQANVGSAFTADKISYKVRHVFGGEVQEHRSFYRQVVAGS
jgi:3-methyladenine DNA glycosylase AlkD